MQIPVFLVFLCSLVMNYLYANVGVFQWPGIKVCSSVSKKAWISKTKNKSMLF